MKNKILWPLQIVTGLAFLAAGGAKFAGVQQMVDLYDKIGIGQWFRYVTALFEVAGAIALFTPKLSGFAAVLLAWVMLCAALTQIFIMSASPVPPIVLLAITAFIASQRLPIQWRQIRG